MAFDPVLMIMQPRQINEAINSLKENIDIPKVWFKACLLYTSDAADE